MIVKLKKTVTQEEINELMVLMNSLAISYHLMEKENTIVIPKFNDSSIFKNRKQVESVREIDTPFQLASNIWKKNTFIHMGEIEISTETFTMMAGPCSVESEEQIFKTAEFLSSLGVRILRGGAFKPRTSPYSFRGLGVDGLRILRKAADQYGMKIVTEILDLNMLDEIYQYADILQVGSRNMQNFFMLHELGKINKPVLLKRGMNAKIYEWLLAAEYILSGGNNDVIMCERGIRSFDPQSRNVMDLGAVSIIRELSHLPVIVDPSHGTGHSSRVAAMSLAAAAVGADGLIIEIHPDPSKALSDKEQAMNFEEFADLYKSIQQILPNLPMHRKMQVNANPSLNLQSI